MGYGVGHDMGHMFVAQRVRRPPAPAGPGAPARRRAESATAEESMGLGESARRPRSDARTAAASASRSTRGGGDPDRRRQLPGTGHRPPRSCWDQGRRRLRHGNMMTQATRHFSGRVRTREWDWQRGETCSRVLKGPSRRRCWAARRMAAAGRGAGPWAAFQFGGQRVATATSARNRSRSVVADHRPHPAHLLLPAPPGPVRRLRARLRHRSARPAPRPRPGRCGRGRYR